MWYSKDIKTTAKEVDTNIINGLTKQEANERIKKYGYNKLSTSKGKSLLMLFLEQLNDALIYILIAAAIISALLGEISDSVIIAVVILINAIIGVIQEAKAEKALEALKKLSSPKAIVKRNGELIEIPSEEIVIGDILLIDAGRIIPCDIRLIETANLKIEESALTGESVPVEKDAEVILEEGKTPLGDQKNMLFMSTLCTYGRGIGIATGTGMNTEIGKIAEMLESGKKELTPLQKKLDQFGKYLGIGILIICSLIFAISFLKEFLSLGHVSRSSLLEMFLTSISLAVAAIPEGLPAIVTIVLAMGVQKMIKENAIVRKLPAVETLGAVNIVCSDKTGTLTQNKMTVTKFFADNCYENADLIDIKKDTHKLLIENMVLCNDASYSEETKTGDPTEIALLVMGAKNHIYKNEVSKFHERVNEIPFDSDRKLMTTVNKYNKKYYVLTKGALDNLLNICTHILENGQLIRIDNEIKANIVKYSNAMAGDALRVLGAAYKEIDNKNISTDSLEKDLILIGFVGMIDPPRDEVKESIKLCKNSGIKTIMITGDHKNTAYAIAKELGICKNSSETISGTELSMLSQEELNEKVNSLRVFARVSPEHKVKIVKAFKSSGNIVSMTGDGVNDAPSLQAADIGVAMGITGTDVAKGASDMILTDDNFKTIVAAISEGRNIYNNIKKSILFLLSCNAGEIMTIFAATLLGWVTPLKPIHILWINLITDTLPALSLGIDPGDPNVMDEKPRNPKESLFAGGAGLSTILNGILIGFITLLAFKIGLNLYGGSIKHAQTMAFVVLSISQLCHAFNLRHPSKSIFMLGFFTNMYLVGSLIIGIFLQDIVITVPFLAKTFKVHSLNLNDWLIVGLLSIVPLAINEIAKVFIRIKNK